MLWIIVPIKLIYVLELWNKIFHGSATGMKYYTF